MKIPRFLTTSLSLVFFFALTATAGDFKHITIDGSFDDWAGIPPAFEDSSDTTTSIDYAAVYIANDADYLYLRFTLHAPGDPFTSHENIFIDADNDPATGYHPIGAVGSEMLIQGGAAYQEKGGGFNEGTVDGLDWAAAPAVAATNFEVRISRHAVYASQPPEPVFIGDTIAFVLEAETSNYNPVEYAPDGAVQVYSFAPAPPAATGNTTLVTLTTASLQVNASGNDLGTAWRETGYDDTQAGWSSGAGLFGFTTNAASYPAAIQTPLSGSTYYLRTRFQWTNDPASVILVASNYLSDGAVFYLNGAEVKRVRLPSGEVSFNTAATGGPSIKGQAELAGFSTAPLVIGENVLAVEVHQTSGDSADLVAGLSLIAAPQFPVIITDPSQPADRSVGAGDSTTFSAEFVGTPPLSFQWLKDGNPITDATNATFTIDPVLQGDAGSYSIRIGNLLATNVTRSALLTVTNSPVRITDPNQPADQTVMEGLPVTFDVAVVGSAPISYQWFKGTTVIANANAPTYNIPAVQTSDAGDYHVVVTNQFPSSVTSRTAHLTVITDTSGPTLLSATGTPNKVTITFSEPVTAASATATTNYSLNGGLTVTAAAQDPNDPAVVLLTTSAQTLGVSYILTVNNVFDRFNNRIASNTQAPFQSTIVIDGSFDDWATVPLAFTDPQDSTESTDYKDVYIANDADYIYLRVTLHTASDLAISYNNLFIDADNDPATGYHPIGGMGSELLIQDGGGYQEKGGGFNEGTVDGLDWLIAPEGVGTDFEFRFSRHATYASDGTSVFTTNVLAILLEAENTSYQTRELAPDAGIQLYTFVESLGPVTAGRNAQGQVVISWSGPGRLESKPSLTSGSWQEVPNALSPYPVQPTNGQSFYRLAQ